MAFPRLFIQLEENEMNIFDKLIDAEYSPDVRLGSPAENSTALLRRMNAMSNMARGNGFRVAKKEPRVYADGKTRGDKKSALREACMEKVCEARAVQFLHSSRSVAS